MLYLCLFFCSSVNKIIEISDFDCLMSSGVAQETIDYIMVAIPITGQSRHRDFEGLSIYKTYCISCRQPRIKRSPRRRPKYSECFSVAGLLTEDVSR